MNYVEFARKIKTKYPDYADMDDRVLAEKIIAKYPNDYNDVTFDVEQPKGSYLEGIGKGAVEGVKEISGMALGAAQLPYQALRTVYQAGGQAADVIRGNKTLKQAVGERLSAEKEGLGQIAKPFVSPVKSFKEAPIGTTLSWASIAFPAAQGIKAMKSVSTSAKSRALMIKAIKPGANNSGFNSALQTAMPELDQVATEIGKPITNINDLNKVIDVTKKKVWSQYDELLKQASGNDIPLTKENLAKIQSLRSKGFIKGDLVADEMIRDIPERFKVQNPNEYQSIIEKANSYRGKKLTPQQAEDYLQSANNDLNSYYAKNKVGQKVAKADPSMGHVVREAEALRKNLYSKLDELTGSNSAGLKRLYGALVNIEKESVKRAVVANRQSPFSLQEQINYPFALAKGVGSVVRGDVLGGTEALGQMALSRSLKVANTTDNLIKRAFEISKEQGKKSYGTGKMLK